MTKETSATQFTDE